MLIALLIVSGLFSTPQTDSTQPNVQSEWDYRWGWDAHKMVCAIAWWDMEEQTREAVSDILSNDSYDRFMESCLWADVVRGRIADYDRWTTAHYVNLPRGATELDLERDCANTFCVVEGIIESRETLADESRSGQDRLDALKFLSHFVGDIHQPMHAGYADDRGGNDTKITLFGRDTNLHAAWDFGLLETVDMPWIDYASHLYFEIDDADREAWASNDPARWSEESFAIISVSAYDLGDGHVGEDYFDRHIEQIETRIKQAGVRLADALDDILGS